jgi:hypothetical protein
LADIKLKVCADKNCSNEFKQYNSLQKYCGSVCMNKNRKPDLKLKSLYKIPKVSDKRKVENAKYLVLRIEFLGKKENNICPITKYPATEIHHTYCGKDRAKYYLDTTTWIAVSRDGHNWIHDNPKEARELGYLK